MKYLVKKIIARKKNVVINPLDLDKKIIMWIVSVYMAYNPHKFM
jgi:hypothetical protein